METRAPNRRDHTSRRSQRGTALPVVLIAGAAVAAGLSTFTGRTLSEQSRLNEEVAQEQAAWRARGEIEFAKCVIAQSEYEDGRNETLQDALRSNPPLIPGTSVYVEEAGPDRWYRLTSIQEAEGVRSVSVTFVRDGLSYVAYNYYVEQHGLGISGQPRGRIHTNKQLQIYFSGAQYDSLVSAGEGFEYLNGASEENTTFGGGSDPAADEKTLLQDIDLEELEADADWSAPPGLEADVYFSGQKVRIKLYEKSSYQLVPSLKKVKKKGAPVWKEVTKTEYEKQYKYVDVKKSKKVWVEVEGDEVGGGTDIGGGGSATGYWKTTHESVKEWRWVKVAVGTSRKWQWVSTHEHVYETTYKKKWVKGDYVETVWKDAEGVYYFPERIKSLRGDLNGHVTLVTNQDVEIRGSLRYRDDQGETAFLNGLDHEKPYDPNPAFQRDHSLGIVARRDIVYDRNISSNVEINGSLISMEGRIGFEGIELDAEGDPSRSGGKKVKSSLRRYGSLMCAHRPVSTLLDKFGQVETGFKFGSSVYDRSLLSSPPLGYPSEESPRFYGTLRVGGSGHADAGVGERDPQMIELAPLRSFDEIWDDAHRYARDWNLHDFVARGVKARADATDPATLDPTDDGPSYDEREGDRGPREARDRSKRWIHDAWRRQVLKHPDRR